MDVTQLPYSKLIGLQSNADKIEITLEPQEQHLNHLGTIHAAVVFSVAEAAAAQALLAAFPHMAQTVIAVVRSAEVKYKHPASAVLRATAEFDTAAAEKCLARLERKGLGLLDVQASVRQGDLEVLAGQFTWCFLRRESEHGAA